MASVFPDVQHQLAVIRRGVEKIVPEDELAQKLEHSRKTGRPLRVKYGIDPTGIDVHLGHTVPLRKMRQFQELGHQAVIIIGNATALVGDPSGRDEARKKRLTAEDVENNARDYLAQVGKVVDLSQAEVHRNGDWFGTMSFAEILKLCGQVTVAQLLTRDDFAKRYAAQSPIFLHECLYPVMQAFDSVCIGADVELGGTEQLYSFMLARDLQREPASCALAERWMNAAVQSRRTDAGALPQQIGVMSPILVGLDGVRRMGKSLGNYIGISEPPYEMMKKFMQLPDGVMKMYYELLTDIPLAEVEQILAGHPKEAKVRLGTTVIDQYHPSGSGAAAADQWQREIGGGALPSDIPTAAIPATALVNGCLPAFALLKAAGLCPSTSESRRLIGQGGAYFGDDLQPIATHDQPIPVTNGLLLKAGKKRLVRLEVVGG
jgi:tyrosyl-tRNA synthetase